MRLKTFTAPTIPQALQKVRAELGEDAVILSTESGRTGARLVAALPAPDDDAVDADPALPPAGEDRPPAPVGEDRPPAPDGDGLRAALGWHGVPVPLGERLLRFAAASETAGASGPGGHDPTAGLAAALDAALGFQPLADRPAGRPVMLVGPPGVGKTLTAAKLIVDAHRRGRTVAAASCDTLRAGGIEQLEAFTRILDLPLAPIDAAADLAAIAAAAAGGAAAVIDTAGCCPFSREEMSDLEAQIEAAEAEPVLVLAAGTDAAEAAEVAAAFARLGCRRMIATRLDVSRRLGGLLAAAAAGRLAFAGAGIGPHAAEPPAAVNALSLARLLLSSAPATAAPAPGAPATADPAPSAPAIAAMPAAVKPAPPPRKARR